MQHDTVTPEGSGPEVRLAAASTATPGASLLDQERARMTAARNALGAKRQAFFVSLGGFYNHDNLATDHPTLLAQVGRHWPHRPRDRGARHRQLHGQGSGAVCLNCVRGRR